MFRIAIIAGLAGAVLACHPASAQEVTPELEGAPGSHALRPPAPPKPVAKPAPKQATPSPVAAKTVAAKADSKKLAQQAEQQKAEQARLARLAEQLKAQQARLDARAAELAAEADRVEKLRLEAEAKRAADDKRLVQARAEADAKLAAQQAELSRLQAEAARRPAVEQREIVESGEASAAPPSPRRIYAAARRTCLQAAEAEAQARDFETVRYDSEPRLYQGRSWEMRGRMRLEDARDYRLVDTVCEVDDRGEVLNFALLR